MNFLFDIYSYNLVLFKVGIFVLIKYEIKSER